MFVCIFDESKDESTVFLLCIVVDDLDLNYVFISLSKRKVHETLGIQFFTNVSQQIRMVVFTLDFDFFERFFVDFRRNYWNKKRQSNSAR